MILVLLTGPDRYKIMCFLRVDHKGATLARKVLPWPITVLPLWAQAGSNHCSLLRPSRATWWVLFTSKSIQKEQK